MANKGKEEKEEQEGLKTQNEKIKKQEQLQLVLPVEEEEDEVVIEEKVCTQKKSKNHSYISFLNLFVSSDNCVVDYHSLLSIDVICIVVS